MLKLNAMLTPLDLLLGQTEVLPLHYLRRAAGRELGDCRKVAG